MRVNIYSQELTDEVKIICKNSDDGSKIYRAAQLVLHSSEALLDDDKSAVTFWLPRAAYRREQIARAFDRIAEIFRTAPAEDEMW